ncbi:MAG TPA: hypothetical protein VM146_10215 [Steroidobacteraceae bacterium]|nr:hypothetical protein [Steroidobacteraceae bacterium]
MAAVARNRMYLLLAALLAAFVFIGFARTYYLRTLFEVPPITLLLHAHAILFTAWVALFVIQARLIAKQDYRTHMQFGIVGMIVAALVFSVGIASTIASAADVRPRPMGMTAAQFTILPASSILFYGGLVLAGFLLRKRGQIHKRLMVLAMIAILGPPAARLIRAAGLGHDFLVIQMGITAFFVACAITADWMRHRSLHAVYTVGGALLILSWPVRVWFGKTPAWESVGQWMASLN